MSLVFTQEIYMKQILRDMSVTDEDIKIIIDEFSKTKDQYMKEGVLKRGNKLMPLREIIKIIADKNGIELSKV
jgi:hypothetical protein